MSREREVLESMVWQFAYRGRMDNGTAMLCTAGLSALEYAFSALGWDDPHIIEDESVLCDVEGCNDFSSSGGCNWPTTGYWRLCHEHSFKEIPQPQMKKHAIERESKRDKQTGVLP